MAELDAVYGGCISIGY